MNLFGKSDSFPSRTLFELHRTTLIEIKMKITTNRENDSSHLPLSLSISLSVFFFLLFSDSVAGCKMASLHKRANEIDNKISTIIPREYHPIKIFRVKLLAIVSVHGCGCVCVCGGVYLSLSHHTGSNGIISNAFISLSTPLLRSLVLPISLSVYHRSENVCASFHFSQNGSWCFYHTLMVFVRTRYHLKYIYTGCTHKFNGFHFELWMLKY